MLPSYFRHAIKASYCSDSNIRLGACILIKGRAISIGFNQRFKTHPLIRKFHEYQTIHAEVSAILRIKDKSILKNATMVVYRESKDTKVPLLARPCDTCRKILNFFGIEKVIYTTNGSYQEEYLV